MQSHGIKAMALFILYKKLLTMWWYANKNYEVILGGCK